MLRIRLGTCSTQVSHMLPIECRRRSFYTVEADLRRNPSDLEFVNQAEVLRHSSVPGAYIRAGTHHHALEGLGAPLSFGLPELRGKPALIVGVNEDESELLDIYGLSERYVSSRAKDLLLGIDPGAFEFAECATADGVGRLIEPYWMMDVIRVVEHWDEERSKVLWHRDLRADDPGQADNPLIARLQDLYFPSIAKDEHAFYLLRYPQDFIFDQTIVNAWREAGLTGAFFTPLQPPTSEEAVDADHFYNYPYWSDRD